jgi:hypothetical protein
MTAPSSEPEDYVGLHPRYAKPDNRTNVGGGAGSDSVDETIRFLRKVHRTYRVGLQDEINNDGTVRCCRFSISSNPDPNDTTCCPAAHHDILFSSSGSQIATHRTSMLCLGGAVVGVVGS